MASNREEYLQLKAELLRHNQAYYVDATPTISDYDYDQLYRQLLELEKLHPEWVTPDSPSQQIGSPVLDSFDPYFHQPVMQSLDNVYNEGELHEFFNRVQKLSGEIFTEYVVEPKVDGVAVSLRYENGLWTSGGTRGDGTRGDDITQNLKTISTLPSKLSHAPDKMEVRGEVYMDFKDFSQINQQREEAGEALFANPRNATAGTLKTLDSRLVKKRPLSIVLYSAVGGTWQTHVEMLEALRAWKFPVPEWWKVCSSTDEVLASLKELDSKRHQFSYPTDGAVIKVNRMDLRQTLGSTAKAPRWAMAYKFAPEIAETLLRSVTLQVGRTGTITPVAELEPVSLSGTTVSRATLHHFAEIARKDIRIGDTVRVQKAGEIIPEVIEVNLSKRPSTAEPIIPPTQCPACGGQLQQEGAFLRCTSPNCTEKLKRSLQHFAHRGAMDIEGLGETVVSQLVDAGLVRSINQLYTLTADQISELERMGKKSALNLIEGIRASKQRELWRLLFGFGIHHVGAGVARELERHFASLDEIIQANATTLAQVDNIGEVVAQSIANFFSKAETQSMVEALRAHGLNFNSTASKQTDANLPLAGKKFVITGTLSQPRPAFEERIRQAGGEVASSVSAKTHYLLAGAEAGSKLDKAQKLGVTILDEETFEKLLADANG